MNNSRYILNDINEFIYLNRFNSIKLYSDKLLLTITETDVYLKLTFNNGNTLLINKIDPNWDYKLASIIRNFFKETHEQINYINYNGNVNFYNTLNSSNNSNIPNRSPVGQITDGQENRRNTFGKKKNLKKFKNV